MKRSASHIWIGLIFIGIFIIKMSVALAPVFLKLSSNRVVNAVIMQLELEGKSEKDSTEKEMAKEKKFFDDDMILHMLLSVTVLLKDSTTYDHQHLLIVQSFHPAVPTPPPNA